MFPAVWQAVTGRSDIGQPARLQGFACLALKGEVFPGLVGRVGASTAGLIYYDVSDETWQRLDDFEADYYERWTVQVQTVSGLVAAETYVLAPKERSRLLPTPWDATRFEREHLQKFLRKLDW